MKQALYFSHFPRSLYQTLTLKTKTKEIHGTSPTSRKCRPTWQRRGNPKQASPPTATSPRPRHAPVYFKMVLLLLLFLPDASFLPPINVSVADLFSLVNESALMVSRLPRVFTRTLGRVLLMVAVCGGRRTSETSEPRLARRSEQLTAPRRDAASQWAGGPPVCVCVLTLAGGAAPVVGGAGGRRGVAGAVGVVVLAPHRLQKRGSVGEVRGEGS